MERIEDLANSDKLLLLRNLAEHKAGFRNALIWSFLFALIAPVIPSKHTGTIMLHYMEYYLAVPIIFLSLSVVEFSFYYPTIKKYAREIRLNKKLVYTSRVTSKEKSFFKGRHYYIWVSGNNYGPKKIPVSECDYGRIQKGHLLDVEFSDITLTFLNYADTNLQ